VEREAVDVAFATKHRRLAFGDSNRAIRAVEVGFDLDDVSGCNSATPHRE
jgi:hypothetical protein